jgi:hypothetical protein
VRHAFRRPPPADVTVNIESRCEADDLMVSLCDTGFGMRGALRQIGAGFGSRSSESWQPLWKRDRSTP